MMVTAFFVEQRIESGDYHRQSVPGVASAYDVKNAGRKCYPGRMRLVLASFSIVVLSISTIACSSAPESKSPASLEKAAAQPGATKMASGLIYRELRAGSGASPAATSTVKVNYRGTLMDGTEFDSSYKRNEPAEFPLNQVIACWTEGVQKMKIGGKSQLVCPASIAYGEAGRPPVIPGGATLVFEIELLSIGGA
jgi:FKBP-type peptidyl-prolyl cis-trans isomerase